MLGRPAGPDDNRAWLTALAVGLDIFFTRLSFLSFSFCLGESPI